MDYFSRLQRRLSAELTDNVIPFWEEHSIDRECGGFISCLNRDGTPFDYKKQMWMQWREVYMFAALYNSEFRKNEYLEYARSGFDFLYSNGRKPDGSYYFMLNRRGLPMEESSGIGAEVFSESFGAIACAELYLALKDRKYEEEAFRCLEIYRGNTEKMELKPDGVPGKICWKNLAYPMIGMNVLCIMQKAFGNRIGDEEIRDCINRIRSFCEPESGLLLERRKADGSFDLTCQDGRFVNPGHALEGLAFILDYERTHPDAELESWCLETARETVRFGWDAEQGGIRYFRDLKDLPLSKNEAMLKAWWPQCEAATAMLRAYECSRDSEFLDWFEKIDFYSSLHLRDTEYPEWFAYAAVGGRQFHSYKGSIWKTFFHVPRYLLNAVEICRRLQINDKKESI